MNFCCICSLVLKLKLGGVKEAVCSDVCRIDVIDYKSGRISNCSFWSLDA